MGGRADRVYGRYMRLDVGMRGFGSSKRTSKLKPEPPIKNLGVTPIRSHRGTDRSRAGELTGGD